jgi:hypothetical protein
MQGSAAQTGAGKVASKGQIANGAGGAAVLAAGIGSFALGALAVLADKSAAIKSRMIFLKPAGPLSGVTTLAIAAWLLAWAILHWRWRGREIALRPVLGAALVLLAAAVLLTFPPFAGWL